MNTELSDFFFNVPLYSQVEVKDLEFPFKVFRTNASTSFHGYNPWQKYESSFYIYRGYSNSYNEVKEQISNNLMHEVEIVCQRSGDIFTFGVYWDAEKQTLMKYGQLPSVADFHISEVKKYNKLLPEEKMKEFTKAIGLAANGVGIGAFVYLRRIFEYLIKEAYDMCLKEKLVKEEDFQRARMDEKINLLSEHLPNFLVENRTMYSILSLGIHELKEKNCLKHFDALRIGIEIILDEKLDELRKKEKIESAKKKLGIVNQEIKNSGNCT